jgi:hypothetical protein
MTIKFSKTTLTRLSLTSKPNTIAVSQSDCETQTNEKCDKTKKNNIDIPPVLSKKDGSGKGTTMVRDRSHLQFFQLFIALLRESIHLISIANYQTDRRTQNCG